MHSVTCWLRSNTLVNCVVCLIPTVQHFPDAPRADVGTLNSGSVTMFQHFEKLQDTDWEQSFSDHENSSLANLDFN